MARKVAVVLFNLGGPDGPKDVQPFLQNLFSDPAIIQAPSPIRWMLARFISRTRAPSVIKNYAMMDAGGGSPLMPETRKQADALSAMLNTGGDEFKVFIAMRYWHPFTEDVAKEVKAWGADDVVLLPLYPQFSTTTTGSSFSGWESEFGAGAKLVCCYPFDELLIEAHTKRIIEAHERAGKPEQVTLLLSAHGLPQKIVEGGDPYQWQCETFSDMLIGRLPSHWTIHTCYQSRVGPLKWIGPSTEDLIEEHASKNEDILISPIAFVSEHIETLVELGEEYREIAEEHGAASYTCVAALGVMDEYINLLAGQVHQTLKSKEPIRSCVGSRLCPQAFGKCPNKVLV